MNTTEILRGAFDIEIHKKNFINYFEVVLLEDGTVEYATPSHQEKLIAIACKKMNWTRQELNDACPPTYYFDFMTWLCAVSGCVSVWIETYHGELNGLQRATLEKLQKAELYKGKL